MGDELVDDMQRHVSLAAIDLNAERKSSGGLALFESQGTDALALEQANGNVTAAARHLSISRQTLYRKLQEQS